MKKIFFYNILIFFSLCYIFSKEDTYLKNVILIEKDVILKNTIENIIYKETQSCIDFLISQKFINTIPKSEWTFYKKYLIDMNNSENLLNFFLITRVWGIIKINISDKNNVYLIQLEMYDTFDDYFYLKEFYLDKYDIINSITNYRNFVIENIKKYFKPINISEYSKKLSNKRDAIKENRDFEVLLSSGIGLSIENISSKWGEDLGFGINPYFNFEFSYKNFYMSNMFSNYSKFNEPLKINIDENHSKIYYDKTYTNSFFVSLDFGSWFYNRFFLFGAGAIYNIKNIFLYLYTVNYNNREESYSDLIYSLLFFYLKFIFSPIKSASITIKIGCFFSPSNIEQIIPNSPFIEINFKYYFYKNLFFEINIPFYAEGIRRTDKNDINTLFKFNITIGLGYKFKWDKKNKVEK